MPRAVLIFDEKEILADGSIIEMRIWAVRDPVPPSRHRFKYTVFYGRPGEPIVLFDNERGKGDHKHLRAVETPYTFNGPEALIDDFKTEVRAARRGGR
jgi:hypothetical protein